MGLGTLFILRKCGDIPVKKHIKAIDMKTSLLVLGALGATAVTLLFTTKKGKAIRSDIANNVGDWKNQLKKLARSTGSEVSDLQKLVSKEVQGLGEDARHRILTILEEGGSTMKNVKSNANRHLGHIPS